MKSAKPPKVVAVSTIVVLGVIVFLASYPETKDKTLNWVHQSYQAGSSGSYREEASQQRVCLNTCQHANDGVCNDGRFGKTQDTGKSRLVTCDLGTDCNDCGPWTPSGPAPWTTDSTPGPVARLTAKGVQVRAITTRTKPAFQFAYTDPKADLDVSNNLEANGKLEDVITNVFQNVLRDGCVTPNGGAGLVVDVGANFGWFSVLSAVMGCRVLAFEPVPLFSAFLEYNLHLNSLMQRVTVHHKVVSHIFGGTLKMVVPSRGTWGTAGIGGLNIDYNNKDSQNVELDIESLKLDELIHEDVLLLKVDVEGWEWSVMQGASRLFNQHVVQNVVMEYSPGVPERHMAHKAALATIQMLMNLADNNYRIAHLSYFLKYDVDKDRYTFTEITAHNLMYDLVDAKLFSQHKLGCPKPAELAKWPHTINCNTVPESSNPRSVRGGISHNTNIWASRKHSLQHLGRNMAVIPLDASYDTYFVGADREATMGGRVCSHVLPTQQVFNRCPCSVPDVCGEEEAAVRKAAAQEPGLPNNYLLSPEGKLVAGTGPVVELFQTINTARDLGAPYRPGAVQGVLEEVNTSTA